jgi:hypothetical protein
VSDDVLARVVVIIIIIIIIVIIILRERGHWGDQT